jgi:hypothetical protein
LVFPVNYRRKVNDGPYNCEQIGEYNEIHFVEKETVDNPVHY